MMARTLAAFRSRFDSIVSLAVGGTRAGALLWWWVWLLLLLWLTTITTPLDDGGGIGCWFPVTGSCCWVLAKVVDGGFRSSSAIITTLVSTTWACPFLAKRNIVGDCCWWWSPEVPSLWPGSSMSCSCWTVEFPLIVWPPGFSLPISPNLVSFSRQLPDVPSSCWREWVGSSCLARFTLPACLESQLRWLFPVVVCPQRFALPPSSFIKTMEKGSDSDSTLLDREFKFESPPPSSAELLMKCSSSTMVASFWWQLIVVHCPGPTLAWLWWFDDDAAWACTRPSFTAMSGERGKKKNSGNGKRN